MAENSNKDPEYLEIQITVRSKETGKAEEQLFYRVLDAQLYRQVEDGITDIVLSFTALPDSEHGDITQISKDLGIVDPCTCYEKLTGES